MTLQENMAAALRRIKAERGLSIIAMSEKLDISPGSLQSYCSGKGNPTLGMVEQIARSLNVDPLVLIAGDSANLPQADMRTLLGTIAAVVAFPKDRQEKFADLLYQILMLYSGQDIAGDTIT